MAFSTLDRAHPPRRRNPRPEVHIYTTAHRRMPGSVDVRIRFTKVLIDQLGWAPDQRLSVLVGHDEDDGKIIIKAQKDGIFRLAKSAQSQTSYVLTSRQIPLPEGLKFKAPFTIEEDNSLCLRTY